MDANPRYSAVVALVTPHGLPRRIAGAFVVLWFTFRLYAWVYGVVLA